MKVMAFLDYTFIFEPGDPWSNLRDFEIDLGKFLKMLNLEGQILRSVEGQPGRRIVYLRKVEDNLEKLRNKTDVKSMGKEVVKHFKPK